MNGDFTANFVPQFDGPIEETITRIRQMNERLLESSKRNGRATLDAYEKALRSMIDFQEKVADASQLDWVSALAASHGQFVQDVTEAYIKAARKSLK